MLLLSCALVRLTQMGLRGLGGTLAAAANLTRTGPRAYKGYSTGNLLTAQRVASRLQDGDVVLDVGCGDGHLLRDVQMFRRVDAMGVDVRASCRAQTLRTETFDGHRLPFPSASVDTVVFGYVLHHLTRAHAIELLGEAARVSRSRILILEDSLEQFSLLYRMRNRCHRIEADLQYASDAPHYVPVRQDSMFLTHREWVKLLSGLSRTRAVRVESLAHLFPTAHHTLFEVDLAQGPVELEDGCE